MRPVGKFSKQITIWLLFSWISLVVLAPAHSLTHIKDGEQSQLAHCGLCFHQHQQNTCLPSTELILPQVEYKSIPYFEVSFHSWQAPSFHYFTRGPPLFL